MAARRDSLSLATLGILLELCLRHASRGRKFSRALYFGGAVRAGIIMSNTLRTRRARSAAGLPEKATKHSFFDHLCCPTLREDSATAPRGLCEDSATPREMLSNMGHSE